MSQLLAIFHIGPSNTVWDYTMAPKEDVNRLKTTRSGFRAVADQLTKKIQDLMDADAKIAVKKRAIDVYNTIWSLDIKHVSFKHTTTKHCA